MKNVVDIQTKSSSREEAIAWMSRLDSDEELTVTEDAELREWLGRSAAHRKWMHDLAETWDKANVLTELAVPLSQFTETERVVQERRPRAWGMVAMASVLILAIGVGGLYWTTEGSVPSTNGQYTTAIGEQDSVLLSDGSVLLLNTNSEVSVEYGEMYRDVYLVQGEAHFTVAKNPDRAFRVFAGSGRIAALGTAFSVHLKQQEIDVTVTEGRVAVASVSTKNLTIPSNENVLRPAPTQVITELGTLKAGQIASIVSPHADSGQEINSLGNLRDLELKDLSRRMSWTEGSLVFSGEPLRDVLDEISRYTTVTIEFEDPALGDLPVGGLYPVSETDFFFKTLESTFGLNVTYRSATHVIVSAGNQ